MEAQTLQALEQQAAVLEAARKQMLSQLAQLEQEEKELVAMESNQLDALMK